ncbi:MAG TPA: DUF2933 domain-containing protein [Methylomirabilota bacterium]|nr:DUF2933 domain-containing protein [Methylomirabilota bacterium]
MDEIQKKNVPRSKVIPQNGNPGNEENEGRYCAICGASVDGVVIERFGEPLCSETHVEEFVAKVRAAKVEAATVAVDTKAPATAGICSVGAASRGWKSYLGKALCWGVPLLALGFLLAGGGTVLGAAGGLLPVAVALACPLGMYFMMRAMMKTGHENPKDKGGDK